VLNCATIVNKQLILYKREWKRVLQLMIGTKFCFSKAKTINVTDGYEYEMRYYTLTEKTNKFILDSEDEYFSTPP
jgi:hypothetical protein